MLLHHKKLYKKTKQNKNSRGKQFHTCQDDKLLVGYLTK